jgi:hypothetical protein
MIATSESVQAGPPAAPDDDRWHLLGRRAMRYELKFYVPKRDRDAIRELLLPYVTADPVCEQLPGRRYTVRSIYYDTDDLRFYYEKMDGVKVRKKLRVRTYNGPENGSPAYFEIKRKFGRRGVKERVSLPVTSVEPALRAHDLGDIVAERPYVDRKVIEKFRFNLRVEALRPVVLVAYEREAFIGRTGVRARVTFDSNIRSCADPELGQLFDEPCLRQFEDEHFVLEMKFDELMPKWMCKLIRLLNLRDGPYSKFCHGIDAWGFRPR